MQLEEECKNTENSVTKDSVILKFKAEDKEVKLDLKSPNFSDFVKNLIHENYNVVDENIDITCDNTDLDKEALKSIITDVHSMYKVELDKFYENIKKDIKTYYGDNDTISKEIEEYIKSSDKDNSVLKGTETE